jgi:hypothetical protein
MTFLTKGVIWAWWQESSELNHSTVMTSLNVYHIDSCVKKVIRVDYSSELIGLIAS